MSVIDSAGTLVRSFPLPRPWLLSCDHVGDLLFVAWPGSPRITVNQSARMAGDVMLFDATGQSPGSLMRVPVIPTFPPPPLAPATNIALSRDRIYIGTEDSAFVDAYGHDGDLIGTVPIGVAPRPVSDEHFAQAVEGLLDRMAPAQIRDDVRRQVLAMFSQPEMLPPYSALFTDPGGFLWVQTSFPGDSVTTLRVVGGTGEELAGVRLPRSVTVLEIGSDYILATYEADNGKPCIVMYALRRGAR